MSTIESLSGVAQRLLDRSEAALVAASFTINKKFIYTGEPPYDECGQLTVHLVEGNQTQTNPFGGLSGSRAVNRFAQLPAMDFMITWTACNPTFTQSGGDVDAATYHQASKDAMDGIWAIYRALSAEIKSATLMDTKLIDPNNNRLGAVKPGNVGGNVASYTLVITVVFA